MKNDPHIEFTPLFNKQRKSAPLEIKKAFREAIDLFLENQEHPILRNHRLKKNFAGYRSIDVTPDWRAVFKETKTNKQKVVTFHMLGTHEQLYG